MYCGNVLCYHQRGKFFLFAFSNTEQYITIGYLLSCRYWVFPLRQKQGKSCKKKRSFLTLCVRRASEEKTCTTGRSRSLRLQQARPKHQSKCWGNTGLPQKRAIFCRYLKVISWMYDIPVDIYWTVLSPGLRCLGGSESCLGRSDECHVRTVPSTASDRRKE